MNRDEWKAEREAGRTLTREEAERLLVRLQGHYNEPVLPISRYCSALRTWQRSISDRVHDLKEKLFPGFSNWQIGVEADDKAYEAYKAERAENEKLDHFGRGRHPDARHRDLQTLQEYENYADHVDFVFLQITKSSMLGRLLYGAEKLRTVKCPIHDGKWSGIEHPDHVCPHHCGMTGWVYEE